MIHSNNVVTGKIKTTKTLVQFYIIILEDKINKYNTFAFRVSTGCRRFSR